MLKKTFNSNIDLLEYSKFAPYTVWGKEKSKEDCFIFKKRKKKEIKIKKKKKDKKQNLLINLPDSIKKH